MMNGGMVGIMNIFGLIVAFFMPQSWLVILIVLNTMFIFSWALTKVSKEELKKEAKNDTKRN